MSKMMKPFLLLIILSMLSMCLVAQDKRKDATDQSALAGLWILISEDRRTYGSQSMTIKSDGPKLSIEKSSDFNGKVNKWELVLFTDKRGEKNTIPTGRNTRSEVESKTGWRKGELVRTFRRVQQTGQWLTFDVTEQYSISKDGHLVLSVKECLLDSFLGCHDYKRTYARNGN